MRKDLALVMPVYNEGEIIADVVRSWHAALASLGADFTMIVINDGSADNTGAELRAFSSIPEINVIHQENAGHGPSILSGYHMAARMAEWVFQCDSDDEIKPEHFKKLWDRRENYDLLMGRRRGRRQTFSRRLISDCSRWTVRVFFGPGVTDVNTPYRLMRSSALQPIIAQIPGDTFAPNIMITGAMAAAGLPICEIDVPFVERRSGTVSIVRWNLWRSAVKAFWQTLRRRPRIPPGPGRNLH